MKKGKILLIITLIAGLALGVNYYLKNGALKAIKSDDQYLAFIPNVGDGTISVINVENKELINNIEIGETVSHGIATTPDGSKLYTGDLDEGKLFIYDAKNNRLIKTIDTGKRIHGIDITPNGKYVLLASGETEIDDKYNYIQMIDTNTDEIVKTITSDSKSPAHIDFTKDSKFAFVSNVMSNDVSIIDLDKGKIVDKIRVGIMPNESELSPDDKFLYVANVQEGSISIVDIDKRKEIDKIKVSPGTHGVAVTNDGKYVWTTNRFGKNIAIIDIHDKRVIKTINIDGQPNHVSILPNGNYAYVTNLESNNLMIIDTVTYEIIKEIKIGIDPHEIDFIKL